MSEPPTKRRKSNPERFPFFLTLIDLVQVYTGFPGVLGKLVTDYVKPYDFRNDPTYTMKVATGHSGGSVVQSASATPDFQRKVYRLNWFTLGVRCMVTDRLVWCHKFLVRCRSVAWGPDSDILAVCLDNGHVELWRPEVNHQVAVIRSRFASAEYAAWSPDGSMLAVKHPGDNVEVWDTTHFYLVFREHVTEFSISSLLWSRDSCSLACVCDWGNVRVLFTRKE